ncbi:hypothetical protein WJX84_000167 [Apatococcus fuscideae]|uniref:DNA polymerase epsilon subunit n=1 Tax=Apatococcus fuscideae TaxID=2026836 RepID=A0AAW1SN92_9CHLO
MDTERRVTAHFQESGLLLDCRALALLSTFVGDSVEDLQRLTSLAEEGNESKISGHRAQELIDNLQKTVEIALVQIISASECPRITYDHLRRSFSALNSLPSCFAAADDKIGVYLDLLETASNPDASFCELTDIKSLLGSGHQTRYVLGCISQLREGQYSLEDVSGSVALDLQHAETTSGLFTENCIVLAEGQMQLNKTFRVRALGFPPLESRMDTEAAAKGLNFFGGIPPRGVAIEQAYDAEVAREAARIVVLSELWLDQAGTLESIDAILTGFESMEEVPPVFVLLGDFQSFSCARVNPDYRIIQENFKALSSVLGRHTRLKEESKFVLVPGPGDAGPGSILPQPPLPSSLTADLRARVPGIVLASNPCRLRYCTQDIIVFRQDLLQTMRRHCLLTPIGDSQSSDALFEHLSVTLLQQSHLCPLPLEKHPIYWQHDHALRLYPVPSAVILADSSTPAASFTFEGCVCFNPGSVKHGSFAAYAPASREVELCDVPDLST